MEYEKYSYLFFCSCIHILRRNIKLGQTGVWVVQVYCMKLEFYIYLYNKWGFAIFQASKLNLTVIRYTPEGHLKDISSAIGSFLQLCPESWTNLDMGLRFGSQYHRSCFIPVRQLMNLRETEFLDLFLQYWEEGESLLYAIPALVHNVNKVFRRQTLHVIKYFLFILLWFYHISTAYK